MKKLFGLLLLSLILSACGGMGTVPGMAGTWVSTQSGTYASYQLILDMSGSDDDFSGQLESLVGGFSTPIAEFTGSRSGSAVELSFFSTESFVGTLSGNSLTFDDFVTGGATPYPLTFTKQ